jgi:hypothetical protein
MGVRAWLPFAIVVSAALVCCGGRDASTGALSDAAAGDDASSASGPEAGDDAGLDAGAEASSDATSGADVFASEGGADGGDAGEAGAVCVLPCTPGSVPCGATACATPATSCCLTATSSTCGVYVPHTDCATGTLFACTEAADCAAGQVCCATVFSNITTYCATKCGGHMINPQLCSTDAECGVKGPCVPTTCTPGGVTFTVGVCKLGDGLC